MIESVGVEVRGRVADGPSLLHQVSSQLQDLLPDAPLHCADLASPESGLAAGSGDGIDSAAQAADLVTDPVVVSVGGGAWVRLAVGWPRQAQSRPADTLVISATLENADDLPAETAAAVFAAVERVGLTDMEWDELVAQMPLTHRLPDHLPADCLARVAPVFTVHHMSDFLVMVDAAQRMGVPAEAMTVIDKGYAYRHAARVDAHLHRAGIAVWPWTRTAEALTDHAARAGRLGRAGLLVDDGGYTLPVLLRQLPHLLGSFIGLVEQTMSGITKLEPFTPPLGDGVPVPVFSVAQSRLKATIESYGVADAAVRNVLHLLPNEKFEGQAALVLGFGRIGEQVAEILRSRRMRVAVYDEAIVRLIAAHERGFVTDRSLPALLRGHRPLLVVGSTGHTSLRGEHAAALGRDCYLVSTTSRNTEFAIDELRGQAVSTRHAGILGLQLRLRQGVTATVVGDGFPINFHYAESMPNKYADLVLASLLVGAATLATPGHVFEAGHNVAATDRVLEGCGLLERYYNRFGPGAGS